MDISSTTASKSDQMDYQDFLGGEAVFTIQEVRKGPSAEQPVEVVLAEFDRPWRPSKSMRRVLVAAWGKESEAYLGRQICLFGDPTVKWAGAEVGGIRIRAMSHLKETLTVSLTLARGKRAPFKVLPLADAAPRAVEIPVLATVDAYRDYYLRRQSEGAGTDELVQIKSAADNITNTEEN